MVVTQYYKNLNYEVTLKFDYYYHASIEKHIKKATTRLDKPRNINVGDVIECSYNAHNSEPFYIQITGINKVKFCDLTNYNALLEGYLDVGLLKQVLKIFYPNITCDNILVQYLFNYLGKLNKGEI